VNFKFGTTFVIHNEKKNVMEKKSNFNLEKTRTTHFMIGFCVISGIVLSAFSYGTLDKIEDKTTKLYTSQDMIVQRENIVEPPKPQVIPPQTQVPKQDPAPEIDLNQDINTTPNINQNDVEVEIKTDIPSDDISVNGDGGNGDITIMVDPVVDFPDVEATFPGGETAMKEWMIKNLVYPEISVENGDEGRVFLKFVVERDGTISSIEVLKSVSRELDNEAKRMLKLMPKWTPGESSGNRVRSSFTLPINFELN